MKLDILNEAKIILDKFNNNGFEAYIVGGCVRDLILERNPKDYDITTSASPKETMELFKEYKTIPTGIKYGTVTVIINNTPIEVTTFRKEGKYIENRRPESVKFLSNIEEDLKRRDFTINAMAYNKKVGLIDLFEGRQDLEKGIIRVVRDGKERFKEDTIRILRAYRFAGRYDFKIEEDTLTAIKQNMHLLNNVAKERILPEIKEIFESGMDINKMDFITTLFPIIKECFHTYQNNKYHMQNVGEHTYKTFNNIENVFHLKITMLLHDVGKVKTKTTDTENIDHFYNHSDISREMAKNILDDFKFDNETKYKILTLIKNHDKYMAPKNKYVKEKLNEFGEELFFDLIKVRIADDESKNHKLVKDNLKRFRDTEEFAKRVIKNKEPYRISDLKINGDDITSLGYKGKDVGKILEYLLREVIEDKNKNEKSKLIEIVREYKK
ncbi:CCA tRNA nucleotidyltransferase [Anaerofustis stercorihominis]|uniref:CCA tRNA nucleotidyltransferase n=1 Tax=Anaerofustis stercorihominis TaxID=214853 RepID=UPI00214CFBE7|nr:HD domain-containing protein [Anaerofustis stercorihominis]MCR2032892.1 HD domain-containing protein [Anaerofustis stercorihominis]